MAWAKCTRDTSSFSTNLWSTDIREKRAKGSCRNKMESPFLVCLKKTLWFINSNRQESFSKAEIQWFLYSPSTLSPVNLKLQWTSIFKYGFTKTRNRDGMQNWTTQISLPSYHLIANVMIKTGVRRPNTFWRMILLKKYSRMKMNINTTSHLLSDKW